MANQAYATGVEHILTNGISGLTLRIALIKGSPSGTPDNPDLNTLDLVLAECTECDFTNYARKSLTNVSLAVNDTNNRVEVDFDDLTWTNAGGTTDNTVGAALVYIQIGGDDTTPGDDLPVAYHDFGDAATDGGNFEVLVGSDGGVHVNLPAT